MTFTAINPATEAVLGEYPTHDDAFIDAALGSAHEAFVNWKATAFVERPELMNSLAEEIINTHASKSGIRYEPLGPLLAIMPWNFPLWQIIRVAVPNIMAGN